MMRHDMSIAGYLAEHGVPFLRWTLELAVQTMLTWILKMFLGFGLDVSK